MLKAEDLARREDRRVKGVKIEKTRRDRGISRVCTNLVKLSRIYRNKLLKITSIIFDPLLTI